MSRAHDTPIMHPNAKGRDKFTEIGDGYTTLIKGSGRELGTEGRAALRNRGQVSVAASPGPGCLLDPTYQQRLPGWYQLALPKALEQTAVREEEHPCTASPAPGSGGGEDHAASLRFC